MHQSATKNANTYENTKTRKNKIVSTVKTQIICQSFKQVPGDFRMKSRWPTLMQTKFFNFDWRPEIHLLAHNVTWICHYEYYLRSLERIIMGLIDLKIIASEAVCQVSVWHNIEIVNVVVTGNLATSAIACTICNVFMHIFTYIFISAHLLF